MRQPVAIRATSAPCVRRERIGKTSGHPSQPPKVVYGYRLDNGRGMSATVWTYGASLIEVLAPDRRGRVENVVMRLPDLGSYETHCLNPTAVGAVLGRYARCVSQGRFSLDGTGHQLEQGPDGHHFHGGSLGFSRLVWSAEARATAEEAAVRLYLQRPDGDMGYPGSVEVWTTYALDTRGRLTIRHEASTTRSTILALTSHAFWNLAGSGTIDAHRLAVNAARVVSTDAQHIPCGPPRCVEGSDLDWRSARPIGPRPIDHCYWLDTPSWAAALEDPRSGRTLTISTDQPGLAIYSGDGAPHGRSGLCLQTGALPDSPNRPDFPSSRLDPGETYRHEAVYQLAVSDDQPTPGHGAPAAEDSNERLGVATRH